LPVKIKTKNRHQPAKISARRFYARSTALLFKHFVQTYFLEGVPFSITFTFCTLLFWYVKVLRVNLLLRLLSSLALWWFLPQISHFAIVLLLKIQVYSLYQKKTICQAKNENCF